ncbi:MAG: hypothetical protein Q8N09_04550 [Thermodesulfovibrionia bacterium]|nr:hypothetical protein [Thermodesulfovibrionia bacterium]
MFKIIPLALLLIAACLTAVVILRKIPQLSLIDIESLPKPKGEEVKKRILLERLKRRLEQARKYWKMFSSLFEGLARSCQSAWERLKSMERQFKIKDAGKTKILIDEAEQKVDSSPEESEKIYLEIVAADPKNVEAYEGLAQIYQEKKEQAAEEEILRFLLKLNPGNYVKYAFRLAEIKFADKDFDEATDLASKIVRQGAAELRYLDFLIEAAIMSKQRKIGWSALRLLQKMNPENAKIGEFEERLRDVV